MGRCRFVQPEVVRLQLEDVHRRALSDLQAKAADSKTPQSEKPTPEDLANAEARLGESEADTHWVDVKKRLNAGENRHIYSRLVKTMTAGEKIELDPDKVGKTKILEYLVGWSLTNAEDKPEPPSESAVDNLDDETYREISQAIDWHETQQTAAREQETKNRSGAKISG